MTRHSNQQLLNLGTVVLAILLGACNGYPPPDSGSGTSSGALQSNGTAIPMIVYSPRGGAVDQTGFISFGPPESLGGRVLEGDPKLSGRIDFNDGVRAAGLFKATTGKVEVTFPFAEHATVLEGEVNITDATGQTFTYKPGDSYFIRQGQVIIWDVKAKYVIKSFFNVVQSVPSE